MHIFWFYYSKYSPLASIHLLQRFNSDSNACSSSVCGIASSACVEADWMVGMSSKKRPFNFNFNFGNNEKSQGAKLGEYGEWFNTETRFRAKN